MKHFSERKGTIIKMRPVLRTHFSHSVSWLFDRRQIEGFTQGTHEGFIVANRFTRAIGKFRYRLAVALHQLNNNIQRLNLGISQVKRVPIPKLRLTREEKWR